MNVLLLVYVHRQCSRAHVATKGQIREQFDCKVWQGERVAVTSDCVNVVFDCIHIRFFTTIHPTITAEVDCQKEWRVDGEMDALAYAVLLWGMSDGCCSCNTVIAKELFVLFGQVFTPAVRMVELDFLSKLRFHITFVVAKIFKTA